MMATSSVRDTRAFVRASSSSPTSRGGSDCRAGTVMAPATPWTIESAASVRKSPAESSAREATTPMALASPRLARGPMRSISVPTNGPSSTPGSVSAMPKRVTSPAVAPNSNAA